LFLGAIVLALGSGLMLSHIAGTGSFVETAARIAASERLYRGMLSIAVLVTLSSALLAFALYRVLKIVNGELALLAMIFCLADSVVALVVRMCGFVRLHLYLAALGPGADAGGLERLSDLMRTIAGTTENLGGIAFGIGSAIFFSLFLRSRYMPSWISMLGVVGSVLWTALYFAGLIFPERHGLFQMICFPPMLLAEILAGGYLLFFAMRPSDGDEADAVEMGSRG
jgi:hypothetical protein